MSSKSPSYFDKNSPYRTSLTGRSAVIEKPNKSKHSNRIKTPPNRIRHFADRPPRTNYGTGIYDNGDKLEGRHGVTVELNPDEIYYRKHIKEIKNKVSNNPKKENTPIEKVFNNIGLSNKIYDNLRRGGKYSKKNKNACKKMKTRKRSQTKKL
jgi:hypothetical protein